MNRLKFIFWESDLLAARLLLSLGSIAWAVLLLIRFYDNSEVVAYSYKLLMSSIDIRILAVVFGVHACMSLHSLCHGFKHRIITEIYAVIGLFIWSASAVFIVMSRIDLPGVFPASVVPNIIMSLFAWWYVVRTVYEK